MNTNDDKSFDNSRNKKMMDATLKDLFDAFREAGSLGKSSTSKRVKYSAKNIQTSIKLSLTKLCPMGFYAQKWLEEEIKWS
jgi:DnaJ-class molecular chaperone